MKKITIATLFLLSSIQLSAQLKPKSQDWLFYDFSYLTYLNAPENLEASGFSNGHNITVMGEWMPTRNFGVGFGLGFSSQNYHNNLNIKTNPTSGNENYSLMADSAFNSNKQTVQYIDVPVELRFRTKPNSEGRFFRWYAGAKVGLRINGYADYEDENLEVRYHGLDDLNRFRAGVYTRIGYSFISVYAYYGLTELFEAGSPVSSNAKLSDIRPLAIGISFVL